MAENKKSFVLYADLIHTVRKLPIEKAGELFMTILSYVNDENPVVNDTIVDLVFEPVKRQLKRDLIKYEGIKSFRSEIGKIGGIKSGIARSKTKQNEALPSNVNQNEPDTSVPIVRPTEKMSTIDFFFNDLPNSSYLEKIAISIKVGKEELIKAIPEFRKYANLEYASMVKFSEHFKNWYLKRDTKIKESNPNTTSIVFGKKRK